MYSSISAESEKRRAIARRVVAHLASRSDLKASVLAGSAAHGNSDEHSDIDLLNYYDALPEPEVFGGLMRELGAEPGRVISPPDLDGFLSSYQLEGIQVQTGGELIASLERRLELIAAGDVDWITAKVAMGMLEAMPLHGEEIVRTWQGRAAYPDSLRRREVEANLGFFPSWSLDDDLAARDAELFRRQMLLDGAFRVVAVLSAINRLYFTTFQFKRARAHIERMVLKPELMADRLDRVANDAPSDAAGQLHRLVEDTKAIVRSEMPDVAVEVPWRPRDDRS